MNFSEASPRTDKTFGMSFLPFHSVILSEAKDLMAVAYSIPLEVA